MAVGPFGAASSCTQNALNTQSPLNTQSHGRFAYSSSKQIPAPQGKGRGQTAPPARRPQDLATAASAALVRGSLLRGGVHVQSLASARGLGSHAQARRRRRHRGCCVDGSASRRAVPVDLVHHPVPTTRPLPASCSAPIRPPSPRLTPLSLLLIVPNSKGNGTAVEPVAVGQHSCIGT